MKYHQIVNSLFIGLLVVCVQLHSLDASDEVSIKNEEKLKDLIKLREYLKALNEYNMEHEDGQTSEEKALHVDEQDKVNEDETEDKLAESVENTDPEKRSAYLRFGKRSYLRFGRNPNLGFLRFGKRSPSSFLRFGKRSPAYLRFGRSAE